MLGKSIEAKLYTKSTLEKFDFDYYKNKKIAIVGPADTALAEKKGDYIDSFDIVIRINRSIVNYLEKAEYLGNRTDILFHGLDEDPLNGCGLVEPLKWIEKGVQKVVFPLFGNKFNNLINEYLIRSKGRLKLSCINSLTYNEIIKALDGYRPTTGFAAIYLISKVEYKELYITGFTFFRTAYQLDYRNSESIEIHKKNIEKINLHSPEREFQYFKKIYNKATNMLIDNGMRNII